MFERFSKANRLLVISLKLFLMLTMTHIIINISSLSTKSLKQDRKVVVNVAQVFQDVPTLMVSWSWKQARRRGNGAVCEANVLNTHF